MVDLVLISRFFTFVSMQLVLVDHHSEILCGAALPGAFFPGKIRSLVVLQPKTVFLAF